MKIYTKTGDNGTTSLVGGKRVVKTDPRLEAYGTADELNSFVGLLRAKINDTPTDELLDFIQNKLFNLGTLLATEVEKQDQPWLKELFLKDEDVHFLETAIDDLSADLPQLHSFILPAGNERVALCHVCRTVTRRLERRMVTMFSDIAQDDKFAQTGKISLQFVNRLSDLFFVLAKMTAKVDGCAIFLWKK